MPLAQAADVQLSAAGAATWTDVDNESGYCVRLYKGGAINGAEVNLSADIVTYSFSEAMKVGGAGVYKVKVKATGDGVAYLDGAWSEVSNGRRRRPVLRCEKLQREPLHSFGHGQEIRSPHYAGGIHAGAQQHRYGISKVHPGKHRNLSGYVLCQQQYHCSAEYPIPQYGHGRT